MVKTICYYISDYGYGHAARSIALIRKLLAYDSRINIIICTSFAMNFIVKSLQNEDQNRIRYRHVKNDFGYVLQENSIEIDNRKMNEEYDNFLSSIHGFLENENIFLKKENVNLLIGDISPIPFLLSKKNGIPSIGISNFTWYTAYQEIISKEKLEPLYKMYQQMDYFLPLAGAKEPNWGKIIGNSQGFFCREIHSNDVLRLTKEIKGDKNPYIVYFGLGMKIDMSDLANFKLWKSKNCVFIVSSNTPISGPNIIKIPDNYTESQNYIAVSDVVISKAGWSTVSEAIQLQKPLVIIDRQQMREDQNTIDYLMSRKRCKIVSWTAMQEFEITDKIKKELKHQVSSSFLKMKKNDEVIDYILEVMKSLIH